MNPTPPSNDGALHPLRPAADDVVLLCRMLLVRHFEDAWGKAYLDEEIDGIPPALSTGQEAVAVGVCAALLAGDFVFTSHRGQAVQLAMGLDPGRVMADLYCRSTGYNKGKSYHVTDIAAGVIGMGGIVGAQVPVAGGMALAQQMRGTGGVSVVFFGDGAANEGAVHETMNLAAIWALPLILICENNGWCISLPAAAGAAVPNLADRAAGYGLPGVVVDGNDPIAVRTVTAAAAARARAGAGATFIEAKTLRLGGHLVHDPQRYRTHEEIATGWINDPIARLRAALIAAGVLDGAGCTALEEEVRRQVTAAVEFARSSPWPDAAEAFTDVWAGAVES